MANAYDVVVIGAGTGGYVAAIRAAQLGKKVAVVEKQKALGGTCLIWGCIPTKALLEHAHALKVMQNAKEWGVTIPAGTPAIDMGQVQTRKDKIVGGLTKGVEYLFKKNKIDWIKGTARLAGKGKVVVTDGDAQELQAAEIIVATGSYARSVPGIEIDRTRIITSDEAIHLKAVPKSIVIMGSGAVGVEFASIYRRFGSEVTIIELLPRLVPVEDEAVSARAREVVQEAGHHRDDRHQGDEGRGRRQGRGHRGADAGRRHDAAVGRAAAGGHRARAGDHRARRRRGWAWRWSAATSRWTSSIARRCRTSRPSATW